MQSGNLHSPRCIEFFECPACSHCLDKVSSRDWVVLGGGLIVPGYELTTLLTTKTDKVFYTLVKAYRKIFLSLKIPVWMSRVTLDFDSYWRWIVDSRWGKLKAELGLDFPVPSEKLYLDKPHDASGSHHRRDEEIPKTRTIDSFCTSPLAKQKARIRRSCRTKGLGGTRQWKMASELGKGHRVYSRNAA